MKRLTILAATMMMAASMFAVTVTYEYNGGKTNDYGWKSGADMYKALAADIIQAKTDGLGFGFASTFGAEEGKSKEFGPADTGGKTGPAFDIQEFDLAFYTDAKWAGKWGWLNTYLQTNAEAAGTTAASSAAMRYAIAAFFADSIRPGWPKSADFTNIGISALKAYQPTWKGSYVNETNSEELVELYAPYFEGESFLGWYDNAAFEGKKYTVEDVKAATADLTLYAKHGEYIPTMAELFAMMPADTAGVKDTIVTKAQGTVTFVNGGQFYMQDETAGMLCYTKNHGLKIGDKVIFSCGLVNYNGLPELINVNNVTNDGNAPIAPLAVAYNDVMTSPMDYMFEFVSIEGVKIAEYDASGNMYIYAGIDTCELYNPLKVYPDQNTFKVGKRVNFSGIVAMYKDKIQFVNTPEQISLAPVAGVDTYAYPEVEAAGYKFNFSNKWIYSAKLNNWSANKPNPSGEQSRGMAAINGKVYVSWFVSNGGGEQPYALKVYDAETGEKLDDILLEEHVGSMYGDTAINIPFGFFCELKNDQAGHLVTNNLPTTGGDFIVYVLNDPENPESYVNGKLTGYPLINKTTAATLEDGTPMTLLRDDYPDVGDIRFDRLAVLGDVTGDAVVYCPRQQSQGVCWFQIKDGKWDQKTHYIDCQLPDNGYNFGYTPQIFPVEGGMFYVDGSNNFPILYDADGFIVDSFDGDNIMLQTGIDGETTRKGGACGVMEFELNGAYLLAIAGENFDGESGATTTFVIYACADEERAFSEMTQLYEYPHDGMAVGANNPKNPQFVQTNAVIPVDEKTADIYAFAAETGLAGYTLTAEKVDDAVENINNTVAPVKFVENNQVVIVKDGVKYNVLGVEVK